MTTMSKAAVGATAIVLGVITAVTPSWASTTAAGSGFTLGFGVLTVIYGVWSLVARDATRDHWSLSVVGLILFCSPWVAMYAGDAASWVAWSVGLTLMILCGSAYLADEVQNVSEVERVKALATYQVLHGHAAPRDGRDERLTATHGNLDSRAVTF